jgi:uncharacterized protein YxeA
MEIKTLITIFITAAISCMFAAVFFAYQYGIKARPVYIKAADVNHKLPEILRDSGVILTDDQTISIYRKLNQEKDKIGF